jgi:phosphoglucosamine mutase
MINVPVLDRAAAARSPQVLDAAKQVEGELGGTGRVLLRPSGTEQLVRVMVEAGTEQIAKEAAERIAHIVRTVSPTQ